MSSRSTRIVQAWTTSVSHRLLAGAEADVQGAKRGLAPRQDATASLHDKRAG
jgi:hypothetical protein